MLADELEEPVGPIIHNQFIGEVGFRKQWHQTAIVGYLERDVRITTQDKGDTMFLTQPQDL